MQQPDQLSTTFAALADPTRRAILARLAQGEASVKELAAPFEMSLPAISKHLRVLERAGLIEQGRQAQWRPCRLGPSRCATSPTGSANTDGIGRRASNGSTTTSGMSRTKQGSREKETTMTATRIDRGSTTRRPSTRTGATSSSSAPSTPRASASGRRSSIPRSSRAGGARRHHDDRGRDGRATGRPVALCQPRAHREDVAFYGEYLEIDPLERFRWTFMFDVEGVGAQGGPETHTFEDLGGRTRVTVRRALRLA